MGASDSVVGMKVGASVGMDDDGNLVDEISVDASVGVVD